MKKLTILLLIAMLVSCQKKEGGEVKHLVTSFYPIYIMTNNIIKGVPGISVVNMAPTTAGCLHDYQLRPADLKLIEHANAFIINGSGAENFIGRIEKLYPALPVVDSSRGFNIDELSLLDELHHEHHHDHQDDDVHSVNEHFWMSIPLAIEQVNNIADQLSTLDSANKERYLANAADYNRQLLELFSLMQRELEPYQGREIITFHEAFDYFAADFDLKVVATFQHTEGVEPTPTDIANLIELVKEKPEVTLFGEVQYPDRLVKLVANETNKKIFMLDSAVGGDGSLDSYQKAMMKNVETLKEAFNN